MCFACVSALLSSDKSLSLLLSQFQESSATQTHTEPHIFHFWSSGTFPCKPFPSLSVPKLTQHITSHQRICREAHTRGKGREQKSPHHKTKFPCLLPVARKRSSTQHQLGQGAPRGQLLFFFNFCILSPSSLHTLLSAITLLTLCSLFPIQTQAQNKCEWHVTTCLHNRKTQENTGDKAVNNIKMQPTVVPTLTSHIPAHLLPGNGMSDYL